MQECMKPHPLLHTLAGIGIGFVLIALIPSLVASAMLFGIILVVVGIGAELMMGKKK